MELFQRNGQLDEDICIILQPVRMRITTQQGN